MPFILPARTLDSGYDISNSLRFNDSDSAFLSRTPSSASNRKTWTFSTWLKRSQLSTSSHFFGVGSGTVEFSAYFVNNNDLEVYQYDSGTYRFRYITNQVFRDISAWYHIVIACDTTQGSASDRVKIYVNNSQLTSFSTNTTPSQNQDTSVNLNTPHKIGVAQYGSDFYDGYISETYLVDGSALAPTEFGETNDNGVWIPKRFTGSFGSNGFKLEYKQSGTGTNASGMGADTSGNTNHFAVNNLAATDVTTDTPTNNFCTMNPLSSSAYEGEYSFAEGNTEMHWTGHSTALSTIGVSSGKWYVEVKKITSSGSHNGGIVFEKNGNIGTLTNPIANEQSVNGVFPLTATGESRFNQATQSTDSSWTLPVNDILGYYIDLDNGTLKVYKNGSAFSTAFTVTLSSSNDYTSGATTFFGAGYNGDDIQINFGNPPYSISSSNTDANGFGNFEYNPTIGGVNYYALCTKNLAEFG